MSTTTEEQPKIILHWLEKSRSQRIVWLLEECKIPYEIKTYKRVNRLAGPELMKVHPLGKSPVVTVQVPGQAEPITLAESAFICEYLSSHFATHLIPAHWKDGQEGKLGGETSTWLRYEMLMHYCEGSLMTAMMMKLISTIIAGPDIPFFIRPITKAVASQLNSQFLDKNVKTHLDFVEEQLATSGGDYLCGKEITNVDIMMSFTLVAAVGRLDGVPKTAFPQIKAYVKRIEALPVYQQSIKKVEDLTGEKYQVVD